MGVKLLSKDYDRFVNETFTLPKSDFYDYYLNIVNEHYLNNLDIISKLINAVNRWIEWYRAQRGHHIMWEVDENGNKTLMDQDKVSIPLLASLGIRRHIDKSFFDSQIEKIRTIGDLISFYDLQRDSEKMLPDPLLDALNKSCPFPDNFDHDKITKRFESFKIYLNAFNKAQQDEVSNTSKKEETRSLENIFKEDYRNFASEFIDILKTPNNLLPNRLTQVINEDGEVMKNKKGVVRLFIEELQTSGIIYQKPSNESLARIFSSEFKNLGDTFFSNDVGVNAEKYREFLIKEIKNVKLRATTT